jgi:hypothetical protein
LKLTTQSVSINSLEGGPAGKRKLGWRSSESEPT